MRMLILFLLLTQTAFAADAPELKGVEFRLVLEEKTADSQEFIYKESRNKEIKEEKIYLSKDSLLPATPIERAAAEPNPQSGDFQVAIKLTDEASKKMAEVSRKYLDRRIALIVDGQVIIAPTVRSEITGGQLVISGNYTEEETTQLAKRINSSGRKAQP